MEALDYRNSHLGAGKAASYHEQFSRNPYRAMMWRLERRVLDSILAENLGRAPAHLDFACGTGRVLSHLRGATQECVGIDVSEGMLDIARAELPGCELICGDITTQDLLTGRKFDLVTAFRFFPNAQPELRAAAISALARHLADDGILVFNNHKNRSSFIYRLARLLRRGSGRRDMSDGEAKALVGSAGLEVIQVRHLGAIPSTERFRLLPVRLIEWLETRLARFPVCRGLSSNLVYVCRRATDQSSARSLPLP